MKLLNLINYFLIIILIILIINEIIHSLLRQYIRYTIYLNAVKRSKKLNKPLIVIGNPNNGLGSKLFGQTYGYGDICIDLIGCLNKDKDNHISIKGDATKSLKQFTSNSSVIFVSCVLEYIDDIESCIKELKRVANNNIFVVIVSKYCLSAYIYGIFPTLGDSSRIKNIFTSAPPNGDFVYKKLNS